MRRRDTYEYQQNRRILLAQNDLCAWCGHRGAKTADHIIPASRWPIDAATGKPAPGRDALTNLRPMHGSMGSGKNRIHNPCPYCGVMCNQVRGNRARRRPQTRVWFPEEG
jgi:5-methylcytosine-specific restriction endonuclease McrA